MAIHIPDDVRVELLKHREEFGLSLSQMTDWLQRRHNIKISRVGLFHKLARWEKEGLFH